MRKRSQLLAIVVVLAVDALFACAGRAQAPAPIPTKAPSPSQVPAVAGLPPAPPPVPNVKITLVTVPSAKKVLVSWGKKRLGVIAPRQPLIIQRPRDSGPLDLLFTSEGYVTVQTRAFTFADNKLAVRLTPIDQKNTLLGYREELPPDVPDGGAPPSASAPPPGLPAGIVAPPPGAPVAAPPPDGGAR